MENFFVSMYEDNTMVNNASSCNCDGVGCNACNYCDTCNYCDQCYGCGEFD